MSNKKRRNRNVPKVIETLDLSGSGQSDDPVTSTATENEPHRSIIGFLTAYVVSHRIVIGIVGLGLLLGLGVFAKNGWLPHTDASGKKTGWFGKELPRSASSSWNPLAAPLTTPTPQLSKEYLYAGSRLLTVEDANASAVPPADLAVWRPSNGLWYVMGGPGSATTYYGWGMSGDIPVQGDFDGDGKTDFAIYRPSTGVWYIVYSSDSSIHYAYWGVSTDLPAQADFDGDGKTDIAVYRPSTGVWYILYAAGGNTGLQFGESTDKPFAADFDGDGKADPTIWRDSNHTFYTWHANTGGYTSATLGSSGDTPVCADYDGDGKANYAVRHNADWIIMNAAQTSTTTTTPSGDLSTDIPVPNDYDGDGKTDIAVWRPSNGHWYIRKSGSSNALREESWGMAGDIPVPAYYRR